MNISKFSLSNRKVIYFFLAVMFFGGIFSYDRLGKKEDAPFVIKQAVLTVSYTGATPREVEQLVVEPIEREVQSMSGVYKIQSDSYFSRAKITVELDPSTPAVEIPQKWDELRRKVLNIQPQLPEGVGDIVVSDDFGDVFGIYYGLVAGGGFSDSDLRYWGEELKRELSVVDGVQKVALYGVQTEVVNVFIPTGVLNDIGITPDDIYAVLAAQNRVVSVGQKRAGELSLTINSDGVYRDVVDIENQVITIVGKSQVRLGDIAVVETGYREPAVTLMRVNGQKAIGVGVATIPERDVVATGRGVQDKLYSVMQKIPLGIELVPLYLENEIADQAGKGFVLNLFESLLIVIGVILLVMGWRQGVLIGSSLLFSIGGTMLLMLLLGTGLNRTSLAGFIIAMGMLVDNAIVVSDNAVKLMRGGMPRNQALIHGAQQTKWSLLGATLIGIFSFLPLYLAPSATAEIVKPLFVVLALSLMLSWMLALSQTPLFGSFILRERVEGESVGENWFYAGFRVLLGWLMRWRWGTVVCVVGLFVGSLWLLGWSPKSFFPSMDKPYFRADCILPSGYSIEETDREVGRYAEWLMGQVEVCTVSVTVGSTPLRYYLASTSLGPLPNVANLLVEVESAEQSAVVEQRAALWARDNMPNAVVRSSLFKLSPAVEATVEFGVMGGDIDTLQMLVQRAVDTLQGCSLLGDVRNSWGNKVPVVTPVYSQVKGQRLGVSRHTVANYISLATSGVGMGVLRKDDQQVPILLKDAAIDDFNMANFGSVPIITTQGLSVPMSQVLDTIRTDYQWSVIRRFNRQRVVKAQADPLIGANAAEAYAQGLRAVGEVFEKLPEGYEFRVFGEQENQVDSNAALAKYVPLAMLLIFVVLLLLFKNYGAPILIIGMLPLILVGVVMGLAVTGKTLDFFAILGLLGLIGMNIKNAVVLVDEINLRRGMNRYTHRQRQAIVDATSSRIVPVVMASGTTILGMLPLLGDALFGGMAATIMGGLFFSTILTILILPVGYAMIFRVK